MNNNQKKKILYVVQKMNRGLHFTEFRSYFKHTSTRKATLELLDSLGIKYYKKQLSKKLYDYKLILNTNVYTALRLIEDYDDSPLAKMYDYKKLFDQLKLKEFSKDEICTFLGAKKCQYQNILTYISLHYPIYEDEETNAIGYL